MSDDPALILVHALAPPTPGGTPVVLQRLLVGLPETRLHVLTNRALRRRVEAGGPTVLPAPYRYVLKWPGWGRRWKVGRWITAGIDFVLAVVAGVRAARWARASGARWIMSVTDEGFSPIAGAVAARVAGLPHVVMVFDLWEENAYSEVQRRVAGWLEGPIFRAAALVVGYCQETVDFYRAKHGIEGAFIDTPIDVGRRPSAPVPHEPAELVMAGAVYWVQHDAVHRLLRVARRVEGLRTVAIGPAAQLHAAGVEPDAIEAPVGADAFRARLERSDVLFLGLSFHSAHPEVVRTGTPARLTDFLAVGRPLLVHAPPDSHVARYCRREDLAEVVDVDDDDALEAGLRRVLAEREAVWARAARAREFLERRHDAPVVRRAFRDLLERL